MSGRVIWKRGAEGSKLHLVVAIACDFLPVPTKKSGVMTQGQPRPVGPLNHRLLGLHLQKDFEYPWDTICRNRTLKILNWLLLVGDGG